MAIAMNGFQCTGILPFNRNIFADHLYVTSVDKMSRNETRMMEIVNQCEKNRHQLPHMLVLQIFVPFQLFQHPLNLHVLRLLH